MTRSPVPQAVGLHPSSVELTCALDGLSHRIAEPAFIAGLTRQSGRYRAICGRTVLVGSLLTDPGRRCTACTRTA